MEDGRGGYGLVVWHCGSGQLLWCYVWWRVRDRVGCRYGCVIVVSSYCGV